MGPCAVTATSEGKAAGTKAKPAAEPFASGRRATGPLAPRTSDAGWKIEALAAATCWLAGVSASSRFGAASPRANGPAPAEKEWADVKPAVDVEAWAVTSRHSNVVVFPRTGLEYS